MAKNCNKITNLLRSALGILILLNPACTDSDGSDSGTTAQTSTSLGTSDSLGSDTLSSDSMASSETWVQDCENDIRFADPKIEAHVRQKINVPTGPIRREHVLKFSNISVSGVSSLAGLECITWLDSLEATYGTIEDLSPLSTLSQLRLVYLQFNQIRSITPLARADGSFSKSITYILDENPIESLDGFDLPAPIGDPFPCHWVRFFGLIDPESQRKSIERLCAKGINIDWDLDSCWDKRCLGDGDLHPFSERY
jgi:Leucine-rich repeat (LRR) protein